MDLRLQNGDSSWSEKKLRFTNKRPVTLGTRHGHFDSKQTGLRPATSSSKKLTEDTVRLVLCEQLKFDATANNLRIQSVSVQLNKRENA